MRKTILASLALSLLAFAPAGAEQEGGSRHIVVRAFLGGPSQYRPAKEYVHVMAGASSGVVLHFEFKSGLYRLSKTGDGRGSTSGVLLEANDADLRADSPDNPYRPIVFQPEGNADWMECVATDFPYPNPEPGYWYTWGRTMSPLAREIQLSFSEPRRLRIRVSGVTEERSDGYRVATLVGISELGVRTDGVEERPAPAPEPPQMERAELNFPDLAGIAPLVSLERAQPAQRKAGEAFEYTLRVRNLTNASLLRLVVMERGAEGHVVRELPAGVEAGESGLLVWRIPLLGAGATETIRLRAIASTAEALSRATTIAMESAPLTQGD